MTCPKSRRQNFQAIHETLIRPCLQSLRQKLLALLAPSCRMIVSNSSQANGGSEMYESFQTALLAKCPESAKQKQQYPLYWILPIFEPSQWSKPFIKGPKIDTLL